MIGSLINIFTEMDGLIKESYVKTCGEINGLVNGSQVLIFGERLVW